MVNKLHWPQNSPQRFDSSVAVSREWAMRDLSGCAFDTVNAGSAAVTGGQRVAHGVTVVILR